RGCRASDHTAQPAAGGGCAAACHLPGAAKIRAAEGPGSDQRRHGVRGSAGGREPGGGGTIEQAVGEILQTESRFCFKRLSGRMILSEKSATFRDHACPAPPAS